MIKVVPFVSDQFDLLLSLCYLFQIPLQLFYLVLDLCLSIFGNLELCFSKGNFTMEFIQFFTQDEERVLPIPIKVFQVKLEEVINYRHMISILLILLHVLSFALLKLFLEAIYSFGNVLIIIPIRLWTW